MRHVVSVWQPIYDEACRLVQASRCAGCSFIAENTQGVPPIRCPSCRMKEIEVKMPELASVKETP